MATRDADIDGLYQLSLAEFTPARNALAKARGKAGGAAVKKLQKPNAPAWAVNQLYWQRRERYDELLAAARQVRTAHGRMLSGKRSDVAEAEAAHRQVVRRAIDDIREILRAAGEVATAATMSAVSDTLQAIPGDQEPGRLTRPMKPAGLEALAGLVPGGAARFPRAVETPPNRSTAVTPAARKASARQAAESRAAAAAAKREAAARAREAAKVEKQLAGARKVESRADAELAGAGKALAKAERDHQRLTDQLQFLEKQLDDLRSTVRARNRDVTAAARVRGDLEDRLAKLRT